MIVVAQVYWQWQRKVPTTPDRSTQIATPDMDAPPQCQQIRDRKIDFWGAVVSSMTGQVASFPWG